MLVVSGCGYHHPSDRHEASQNLYCALWENQTSEFGLEATINHKLTDWFSKKSSLSVTYSKSGADLVLSGTVLSFFQPAASYGSHDRAAELRATLTVSYSLQEKKTGKVIIAAKEHTMSEVYKVGTDVIATNDNKMQVLNKMINDLAENIYLEVLTHSSIR